MVRDVQTKNGRGDACHRPDSAQAGNNNTSSSVDPPRVQITWPGKELLASSATVTRSNAVVVCNEHICGAACDADCAGSSDSLGNSNLLIHGDNFDAMHALLKTHRGQVKLIYIDPPFCVGSDFKSEIVVPADGTDSTKKSFEITAYTDTWEAGLEDYLSMVYKRLPLLRELLSEDGSIYVHCDWRVNSHLRLLLDEVFGAENFLNEIIWCFSQGGKSKRMFGRKHNSIFYYAKNAGKHTFNPDDIRIPMKSGRTSFGGKLETDEDGRVYRLVYGTKNKNGETRYYKYYLDEGKVPEDYWDDINSLQSGVAERNGYATQKPEALLERIIKASSNEGDLVADFFCGSGTTIAVAEKLKRRWIGCDLGEYAFHLSRKRMLALRQNGDDANRPLAASAEAVDLCSVSGGHSSAGVNGANQRFEPQVEFDVVTKVVSGKRYLDVRLTGFKSQDPSIAALDASNAVAGTGRKKKSETGVDAFRFLAVWSVDVLSVDADAKPFRHKWSAQRANAKAPLVTETQRLFAVEREQTYKVTVLAVDLCGHKTLMTKEFRV